MEVYSYAFSKKLYFKVKIQLSLIGWGVGFELFVQIVNTFKWLNKLIIIS